MALHLSLLCWEITSQTNGYSFALFFPPSSEAETDMKQTGHFLLDGGSWNWLCLSSSPVLLQLLPTLCLNSLHRNTQTWRQLLCFRIFGGRDRKVRERSALFLVIMRKLLWGWVVWFPCHSKRLRKYRRNLMIKNIFASLFLAVNKGTQQMWSHANVASWRTSLTSPTGHILQ